MTQKTTKSTRPSAAKPKTFKLDIFGVLSNLTASSLNVWRDLSEDERKGVGTFVIQRWLSSINDITIRRLNEWVNPYVWRFRASNGYKLDHTDLELKLMAVASPGKPTRCQWQAGPKKNSKSLAVQVVSQHIGCSPREAKLSMYLLDRSVIIEYAEELGWDKAELKKLSEELT